MPRFFVLGALAGVVLAAVGCSNSDGAAPASAISSPDSTPVAPPSKSAANGSSSPMATQGGHFINPNSSGIPQAGSAVKGR